MDNDCSSDDAAAAAAVDTAALMVTVMRIVLQLLLDVGEHENSDDDYSS